MEISKRIRHEHVELRSLAQQILSQGEGEGTRDRDFASYEHQLRGHLDVFETFFLKRLKEDPAAKDSAADIKSEHALVRKELKTLHRGDKDSHQWSAEFRRFTERFEQLCHRHDALVAHAEAGGRSEGLDREYEQTKSRRLRGLVPSSGGSAATMLLGAAAVAGAAYFLSGYLRGGRSGSANRLRRRETWLGEGRSPAAPHQDEMPASGSLATASRPAFEFQADVAPAPAYRTPEPGEGQTPADPATAPSASGIIIN